mmetsp:Transcript_12384/g.57292  ORF Transcript_12384/g.57292 Transcript_12384/m.57292 type:complete len:231 (-) Transcript_12384:162-854(-)
MPCPSSFACVLAVSIDITQSPKTATSPKESAGNDNTSVAASLSLHSLFRPLMCASVHSATDSSQYDTSGGEAPSSFPPDRAPRGRHESCGGSSSSRTSVSASERSVSASCSMGRSTSPVSTTPPSSTMSTSTSTAGTPSPPAPTRNGTFAGSHSSSSSSSYSSSSSSSIETSSSSSVGVSPPPRSASPEDAAQSAAKECSGRDAAVRGAMRRRWSGTTRVDAVTTVTGWW